MKSDREKIIIAQIKVDAIEAYVNKMIDDDYLKERIKLLLEVLKD